MKYAGCRPPFNELLYLHRRSGLVVRNLPCKLGRPPLLLFPQIKNLREPYFFDICFNSYLATLERICQHSPEATFVKCSPCALFSYKNTFFSKKICTCAFFVVPLQALSKKSISDKACLITLRRGEGWVSG